MNDCDVAESVRTSIIVCSLTGIPHTVLWNRARLKRFHTKFSPQSSRGYTRSPLNRIPGKTLPPTCSHAMLSRHHTAWVSLQQLETTGSWALPLELNVCTLQFLTFSDVPARPYSMWLHVEKHILPFGHHPGKTNYSNIWRVVD